MLGLLLLLGMVPPGGDIASGPPAAHLATDPATQWRLGTRASWRAFQAEWPGRWGVRWDPRNATPRFLWAPGVPASQADALVADVARLAGVDPAELVPARTTKRGDRVIRAWTRAWRGAEVEGDQVAVVTIRGRIAGVWVQLTPVTLGEAPRAGETVLPAPPRGAPRLVRRGEEGGLVVYRDRAGRVVHRYDPRLYANVTHTYEERTVGDALVSGPARQITLTDADGATAVTADDGSHALAGSVDALLDGPVLGVTLNGAPVRASTDGELAGGDDIPYAASTVLHHFHVVWDWLGDRWPTHAWLAERVPADVEQPGTCNAYYTSGTVNFLREQPGACNDLGRIADVVYHEVGHGIHEYILAAGTFASDVSEGSSDYISATILDDSTLAPNAWVDGGAIREIETDKRYPDDIVNEPHTDGLVWASFLWNLRADWGADATDALFLGTLEQGPTLTDLYEAVVLADDDDGDLTNGTPNGCELMERLAEHGLGPGPIGVVRFDHEPLGPQSSWAEGYEVRFVLADLLPECSGLDESSVALWYSVDGTPIPAVPGSSPEAGDTADTGDTGDTTDTGDADPWAGWASVPLTRDGGEWVGVVPRQLAGTEVRYFLQAASTDGTQLVRTESGEEDGAYHFWVGDRAVVWCADFEAGFGEWTHGGTVDEWVTGAPVGGGSWDPDLPTEGASHAATVLDGDYGPDNNQWLQSPVIPVGTPGPMTLLTYQRWLTVEDALYDRAELAANGVRVWGNARSPGGSEHHLDVAWTAHELPIEPLLDAEGDTQLTWTLQSDAGLEFGGWAIDGVCVVTLDDVPGHYRVRDLVATDDADEVTITWTQPWIEPLSATVLVRKAGDWPTGPDDGVILDVDFAPKAGEARLVVDTDAMEGETFHYALFAAAGDDADWHLAVVEGENADRGGVPAPPEDTGDTADTDTPTDTSEPDDAAPEPEKPDDAGGCGCDTGTTGAAWLGLLGLALVRRRRP